jgi:hypothetical protein
MNDLIISVNHIPGISFVYFKVSYISKEIHIIMDYILLDSLVWCPGQNKGNSHRLSMNIPIKRGKEKSSSEGHYQCEKEMDDHLLACQQIFEREPQSDTLS